MEDTLGMIPLSRTHEWSHVTSPCGVETTGSLRPVTKQNILYINKIHSQYR